MLCTFSLYIVNVQWNRTTERFLTIFIFQGGALWWTAEEENDRISMKKKQIT